MGTLRFEDYLGMAIIMIVVVVLVRFFIKVYKNIK
jgi:hypothetical protein